MALSSLFVIDITVRMDIRNLFKKSTTNSSVPLPRVSSNAYDCETSISDITNHNEAKCHTEVQLSVENVLPKRPRIHTPEHSTASLTINQAIIVNDDCGEHPTEGFHHPHHEPPINILPFKEKNRTLFFQLQWYERFPWIHYSGKVSGVVCFYCAKATSSGLMNLATKAEPTFSKHGFRNWKKAIEKFKTHEASASHKHAISQIMQAEKRPSIAVQLNNVYRQQQERARACLIKVVRSTMYLLRQGMADRGHNETDGNLYQLLKLHADDDVNMKAWLGTTTNFLSHECIEEIQTMCAHTILRNLVSDIKTESKIFAIVIDGTHDLSGKEQESICIRHVDSKLEIHEDFIGLYNQDETTGNAIASTALDVLLRLDLKAEMLRGQTYDGGANMDGAFKGCQAIISNKYPLCLHFRCSAHSIHLVAQYACEADPLVRDALQWLQELGNLYKRSGKFSRLFEEIAKDHNQSPSRAAIKPLCPTRWLARRQAISSIIDNYEAVLDSLSEIGVSGASDTAAHACSLHSKFCKGTTLLGLHIALQISVPLHDLSKTFQSEKKTISGMLQNVEAVRNLFISYRTEENFKQILSAVNAKVELYALHPISLPRIRKLPQRYDDSAAAPIFPAESTAQFHRKAFYVVIDMALKQIEDRFDLNSTTGLSIYSKLEKMLLTSEVEENVCSMYPELDNESLTVQLKMFIHQFKPKCVSDIRNSIKVMSPDMRLIFHQVENLLRLLLVAPISSCEAERSFSALRRLKTWLRSSMSQVKLNSSVICNVHKDRLDHVSVREIAVTFAHRTETRRNTFGEW